MARYYVQGEEGEEEDLGVRIESSKKCVLQNATLQVRSLTLSRFFTFLSQQHTDNYNNRKRHEEKNIRKGFN